MWSVEGQVKLINDLPVPQRDDPVGVTRSIWIMGDHQPGRATTVSDRVANQTENNIPIPGVEASCRLIG